MRMRRAAAMLELCDPARIRFLAGRGVHGIKANPGYASGAFHQTTHDLAAFPGHHRTCGQCETKRVRLIFEVQTHLPRHNSVLPGRKPKLASVHWRSLPANFRRTWSAVDLFPDFQSILPTFKVIRLVPVSSRGPSATKFRSRGDREQAGCGK